jgi:polysaccharide export outer membrane protein
MRCGLCLVLAVVLVAPASMARGQTAATASAGAVGPGDVGFRPDLDSYRICPGDTLSISVDGEAQLTRECQVNGAGTISYPLLGDVRAAGETCTSLAARLEADLGKYLKQPRVMVTVRQYGQVGMSVFVMGEVARPGAYPLASSTAVMQPIAAAGGMTEFASGEITILKAGTGESRTYLLEDLNGATAPPQALLQPGDVILVDRKKETRYAVLGEVATPGMFDMTLRGETRVLDAMTRSGLLQQNADARTAPGPGAGILDNPTRTADLEHAVVTRGEANIPVNLAALLQGDTSQNLVLQPGDVLTVPRRPGIRVYALGEVRAPGRQYLPENATVLDLVNAAGGTTGSARPADGSVLRLVDGKPTPIPVDLGLLLTKGDAKQNIALREGDVLFIPSKGASNDTVWRLLWLVPRLVL